MMLVSEILKCIDQEELIAIRRDFHTYPEPGWAEFRTASIIAERLRELGFQLSIGKSIMKEEDRMGVPSLDYLNTQWQRAMLQGACADFMESMKGGFTAVCGTIKNGEGPTVAIRFDIDALDIEETMDPAHIPHIKNFRSKNCGVMHSCGHDGHAAVGLGVAKVIAELKENIRGTVKLIFQPAEEGVRGAKSICGSTLLDDVDYIYACHLWSQMPKGSIVCGMNGTTATSKFDAIFHGKAAHAGINPDKGKNALLAAATATLNLHAIPTSTDGYSHVNVGKLNAGCGRNIIPEKAVLAYETRGNSSEINEEMVQKTFNVINASAAMHNCSIEYIAMGEAKSAKSDPTIASAVQDAANQIPYFSNIKLHDNDNRGSEDFTYMMDKVSKNGGKACFIGIGADINNSGHHTQEFDFDEDVLTPSVMLFSYSLFNIMKPVAEEVI